MVDKLTQVLARHTEQPLRHNEGGWSCPCGEPLVGDEATVGESFAEHLTLTVRQYLQARPVAWPSGGTVA